MENDRLTTANQFLDCGGLTHFILNFFCYQNIIFQIYFWNTKRVTSFAHVSESPSVLQLRPTETD